MSNQIKLISENGNGSCTADFSIWQSGNDSITVLSGFTAITVHLDGDSFVVKTDDGKELFRSKIQVAESEDGVIPW